MGPARDRVVSRMDSARFDTVMASADPSMVIVTVAVDDERSGCLVGFHGQTSIEPLRYGVWISKANHTYGPALEASHLAIHHLAADDIELARLFGTETGDEVDKFARCRWESGPHGVPLLADCSTWMVGRWVAVLDAKGDHACVVVEPVEIEASETFEPLRLSKVVDLEPGHQAEGRG